MSHVTYTGMSHVTNMLMSHATYMGMSHVTYVGMSHVTCLNQSRHMQADAEAAYLGLYFTPPTAGQPRLHEPVLFNEHVGKSRDPCSRLTSRIHTCDVPRSHV